MAAKHAQHAIKDLRHARNLRTDFGPEDALLADWYSYRGNPVHPFVITPTKEVIDGNRRLKGAQLAGDLDFIVDCIIREDATDPMTAARIQFDTAIHRADLPLNDKIQAMVFFRDNSPGKSLKEIAQELEIDPTMPSKLLSFERCVPEVQEAVKAGKIGLRDMLAIAQLPPDDQPILLQTKLGGASADQLQAVSRKRRKASEPAVRVARIKCPLPSGVTVQVAGEEVSLEEAVDALAEATKAMKQAIAKGLTAKSFQNMMKDMSAAG